MRRRRLQAVPSIRKRTRAAAALAVGAAHIVLAPLLWAQVSAPAAAVTSVQADGALALTLEDAIGLARRVSDTVKIAAAGVTRAESQELTARSLYLPQLSADGSYTRTLQSQFSTLDSGSTTEPIDTAYQSLCTPELSAQASPEDRAAALAQSRTCSSTTSGLNLSRAGFGAPNSYSFTLSGSWSLFSPGRRTETESARSSRRAANIEVTSQEAQVILDVTEAYFDAVLSDRLVEIAESSLAQSERVLAQTRAGQRVGDQSGYEVMRAQVARDNQVPTVTQRRAARERAKYRLKRLLEFDLDTPIRLTTDVEAGAPAAPPGATPADMVRVTEGSAAGEPAAVAARAPVRQRAETLLQQQLALANTRAQRLPTVSLSGSYGLLAYPSSILPTSTSQFLPSSSFAVSVSVPLFTGGRQRANEMSAQANVREAEARLHDTQQRAAVDRREAQLTVAEAEASYASSVQTEAQATRANEIAEVRYREGLASLTELGDARLDEVTARANRAQAARDMRVARIRLALLNDLPLSTGAAGASTTTGSSSGQGVSPSTSTGAGTAAGGTSSTASTSSSR